MAISLKMRKNARLKLVQDMTDASISLIDDLVTKKEEEIMKL